MYIFFNLWNINWSNFIVYIWNCVLREIVPKRKTVYQSHLPSHMVNRAAGNKKDEQDESFKHKLPSHKWEVNERRKFF